MLTLAGSLRVNGWTVYRDVVYRGGVRSLSNVFYALPDAPRIARDASGGPAFDFVWYRGAAGPTGRTAGGLVTMTVELGPTQEDRVALAAAIPAALGAEVLSAAPGIASMPFASGSVALTFAGDAAASDMVNRVAGSGPARLAGSQHATFSVDLTADGAALLWEAIDRGQAVFHASYDLAFDYRLGDVVLLVWCDGKRAHEAAGGWLTLGPLDAPSLRQRLTTEHIAGFQITSEQTLSDERQTALQKLGETLLDTALGNALLSTGSDGTQRLQPYGPGIETSLNNTFTGSFTAQQHVAIGDSLNLGATREALGERVRRYDLGGGFFAVLEVRIFCTADFAQGPVDKVRVRMDYDEQGSAGRIQRTGEFVFTDAGGMQIFRTDLAAADRRSYRTAVEVFYRGDPEPLRLSYPPRDAETLILDLDGLGVLQVAVTLRDVPLDIVRFAIVELEYPAKGLQQRFMLDGEHPAAVWRAVIRDAPASYRYRASWVTSDDRRIVEDWQESNVSALALDAPRELSATARVMAVAAGDFSTLAQIVLELRPDATAPSTQLIFTQTGAAQIWQRPGAIVGALHYQARRTMLYQDGTVSTTDWSDEDAPVLVVRDALQLSVEVIPQLLDLGGAWARALVGLQYIDASGAVAQQTTLVLQDRNSRPRWTVRLAAPDRRTYRYQLTLLPSQGARTQLPWQNSQDALLVLRPPNPEA